MKKYGLVILFLFALPLIAFATGAIRGRHEYNRTVGHPPSHVCYLGQGAIIDHLRESATYPTEGDMGCVYVTVSDRVVTVQLPRTDGVLIAPSEDLLDQVDEAIELYWQSVDD